MPNRYFAIQYREEIPLIQTALTSLDGEYAEVFPTFANDYLGAGWYPPFDDEVGLYSGIGAEEEQENDKRYDDLMLFMSDKLAERDGK